MLGWPACVGLTRFRPPPHPPPPPIHTHAHHLQLLRDLCKLVERFAIRHRTALGLFSTANLAFIGGRQAGGWGPRMQGVSYQQLCCATLSSTRALLSGSLGRMQGPWARH